jgi:hypothetical protein
VLFASRFCDTRRATTSGWIETDMYVWVHSTPFLSMPARRSLPVQSIPIRAIRMRCAFVADAYYFNRQGGACGCSTRRKQEQHKLKAIGQIRSDPIRSAWWCSASVRLSVISFESFVLRETERELRTKGSTVALFSWNWNLPSTLRLREPEL